MNIKEYGFHALEVNDGRKIWLDWNDVVAMRPVFVKRMHGITCSDKAHIYHWFNT